jgi:hypothetical protein
MKLNYLIASILFLALSQYANSTVTVYDQKNLTIIDYDDYAAGFGPRISDDGFKVKQKYKDPFLLKMKKKSFL